MYPCCIHELILQKFEFLDVFGVHHTYIYVMPCYLNLIHFISVHMQNEPYIPLPQAMKIYSAPHIVATYSFILLFSVELVFTLNVGTIRKHYKISVVPYPTRICCTYKSTSMYNQDCNSFPHTSNELPSIPIFQGLGSRTK